MVVADLWSCVLLTGVSLVRTLTVPRCKGSGFSFLLLLPFLHAVRSWKELFAALNRVHELKLQNEQIPPVPELHSKENLTSVYSVKALEF